MSVSKFWTVREGINTLMGPLLVLKPTLIDGTNILPFRARYIALGQSVAGTAKR